MPDALASDLPEVSPRSPRLRPSRPTR